MKVKRREAIMAEQQLLIIELRSSKLPQVVRQLSKCAEAEASLRLLHKVRPPNSAHGAAPQCRPLPTSYRQGIVV